MLDLRRRRLTNIIYIQCFVNYLFLLKIYITLFTFSIGVVHSTDFELPSVAILPCNALFARFCA